MNRLVPILLLALSSCRADSPRVEVVQKPDPPASAFEQTDSTLDDSFLQHDQAAFRFLTFEARHEGAQLLFLASRTRCPSARIDETATAAFSVEVRKDAAETPLRPFAQIDSGATIVASKSFRLVLKEGAPDLPEDGKVEPWAPLAPGAEVAGLALSLSWKEGTVLAWKVVNHRDAPIDLLEESNWNQAVDRGSVLLHVAGPDGHLLPPRKADEQRLAAPKARAVPAGGELAGEVDLAAGRDLPREGLLRVALLYVPIPSAERLASYTDGVAWPKSWSGALVSNELVLRLNSP